MADAERALDHLRSDCIPAPGRDSDAALLDEWHAARAKLGSPMQNAGGAAVGPIPDAFQPYIDALQEQPWVGERLRDVEGACSFRVVEIDPLLAFQFAISKDRVGEFRGGLGGAAFADLLELCLPMEDPPLEFEQSPTGPTSVIVTSRRRDLGLRRWGVFGTERSRLAVVGARIQQTLPFVNVVRLEGRCYLQNGYHRAYAARMAGASHLPCFFRDVPDLAAAGLPDDNRTFSPSFLASANPPTMAHFTQGRAHEVTLRAKLRVIHVSWHQYLIDTE